ncbi:toprim domain-containing protein [Candidatus Woesearchaeota archaeon]|nr:toprim domain-containing protein [Candidatus Woesearchaeota archaeon]
MDEKTGKLNNLIGKAMESGILVIVEGRKDKNALNKLGIRNIIELNKKPLFSIVEEAAGQKECIILTDLDRKGRELYGKLNSGLQERGVKVDNRLRNFLFKSTKLRQIEGILKLFPINF